MPNQDSKIEHAGPFIFRPVHRTIGTGNPSSRNQQGPPMTVVDIAPKTEPFDVELNFTEVYRRHEHDHIALREAACLRAMYPANLQPIRENDLLAGRTVASMVGFYLEPAFGGSGYVCREDKINKALERISLQPQRLAQVREMIAWWKGRTMPERHDAALPPDLKQAVRNAIAHGGCRLAGTLPDFDKLIRLGIPGLKAEVARLRSTSQRDGRDPLFYEGMIQVLDLVADCCRFYAQQARELIESAESERRRQELADMAEALEHVAEEAPRTFRQGMQLFWIYTIVAGVVNYGRMDVFLGDLYAHDIDNGVISEAEALRLLQSLWQLIADRVIQFNSRVVVGGRGRRNEKNADRFALLAMEATRTVIETEPQLTLRFYEGQDPALMRKAVDVIGEGRTYPMLYNDDVNVPAVAHCFGVSIEEAETYYPYGCGEYALTGLSIGSPNCGFNLLKALEAVLHGGRDALTGETLGIPMPDLSAFRTFEDLWAAYARQVEFHTEALCRRHAIEYEVEKATAPFLLVSLLYQECLDRGRSVVDRGPRYSGAVLETFGMVNVADSLTAIKRIVFDQKRITLEQLVAALDANFEGHQDVHRLLMAAPKFGNDDDEADAMLQRVSNHVAEYTRAQAKRVGLDYCAIVNINNFSNVTMGKQCGASADGRRRGEPLANGNTPTAGYDHNGVTAFLNSLVKIDPKVHAGYTQNMKFSRRMLREDRPKLEALLRTYWAKGGCQAMITVVSRGDLENAMKEPKKYANLIVRVGGFSARFVELSKEVQMDLLKRTLY
jgi:pyruvate-formate lyase